MRLARQTGLQTPGRGREAARNYMIMRHILAPSATDASHGARDARNET